MSAVATFCFRGGGDFRKRNPATFRTQGVHYGTKYDTSLYLLY